MARDVPSGIPVEGMCPHCGGPNPPGYEVCQYCGSPLPLPPSVEETPPAPSPGESPEEVERYEEESWFASNRAAVAAAVLIVMGLIFFAGAASAHQQYESSNSNCGQNPTCVPPQDPSGALTLVGVFFLLFGIVAAIVAWVRYYSDVD